MSSSLVTNTFYKGLYICFLFFCCCCIGTVLHECGHYIAADILGYEAVLQYSRTSYRSDASVFAWANNGNTGRIIIAAGGLLVNTAIGSIGLWLLAKKRHLSLNYLILFAVIAFFWSREIVILAQDLLEQHARLSDEQRISALLSLPQNTLSVILGISGILVCSLAVFRYLPRNIWLPFIVFGAMGSVLGYIAWFRWLGPVLLPLR